jgi:hypothetical protein
MLQRFWLCVWIGCVAALCAACQRRDDTAPCSAVASHLVVVAHTEIRASHADDTLRQRVVMQLPALRDAVDESCSKGNWTAAVRTCLLQARDGVGLEACQRDLSLEQRRMLDRTAPSK